MDAKVVIRPRRGKYCEIRKFAGDRVEFSFGVGRSSSGISSSGY